MKELSLDELKAARLEILKAVDRFCVDNDIQYFLAYGTLLGAVRDGGFVPEEDGIDIMMPRPGYDIFCKGFVANGLEVVSTQSTPDCYIAYARVQDTEKTVVHTLIPWASKSVQKGVWINIFPLDAEYDSNGQRDLHYERITKIYRKLRKRRLLRGAVTPEFGRAVLFKTVLKRILHPLWYIQSPKCFMKDMQESVMEIPYKVTDHVSQLARPESPHDWYYKTDIVIAPERMKFEDGEYPVPVGYDLILSDRYGDYKNFKFEPRNTRDHTRFFWK